jgi:ATP synthase protein I
MRGTHILSKPIRVVLQWQLLVTAALTLSAGMLAGMHGALSAALGGAVSLCAGGVSAVVAGWGSAGAGKVSAGGILIGALRAEGVKIGLIAILLWLVLATYDEVVMPAFLGSFMATILIFSMAFFVREHE